MKAYREVLCSVLCLSLAALAAPAVMFNSEDDGEWQQLRWSTSCIYKVWGVCTNPAAGDTANIYHDVSMTNSHLVAFLNLNGNADLDIGSLDMTVSTLFTAIVFTSPLSSDA